MKRIRLLSVILIALSFVLLLSFSACDDIGESPSGAQGAEGGNTDTSGSQTQAPPHEHTPTAAGIENESPATCYAQGYRDEVVYCEDCGKELSRTPRTEEQLTHLFEGGICIHCNDPKASEGLLFESNGDGTFTVIGMGICTDAHVIIPRRTASGGFVTSIADNAFYGSSTLTELTVPDTVTKIGEAAFKLCTSLRRVTLSEGTTRIEASAFKNCTSLSDVTLPKGLLLIGHSAFGECSSLTSITIPESVQTIERFAFMSQGCHLTSAHFEAREWWVGYREDGSYAADITNLTSDSDAAFDLTFRFADLTWKRFE